MAYRTTPKAKIKSNKKRKSTNFCLITSGKKPLTCTYPHQRLVPSRTRLLDAISVGFASCLIKN